MLDTHRISFCETDGGSHLRTTLRACHQDTEADNCGHSNFHVISSTVQARMVQYT